MSKLASIVKEPRRVITVLIIVLAWWAIALGQEQKPLSFEVASIKPAEALTPALIAAGKLHIGMKVDQARVDIGYVSLADLIPIAFKLRPYQISGPDWLKGSQRYDILAKLPEGSNKDQVPEMLQSLLADRFQLKYHRETRDLPIYALVVSKGGHKLKESVPEPETRTEPPKDGAKDNALTLNAGDSKIQIRPDPSGATITSPEVGKMKMSIDRESGQMHMEIEKVSMEQLATLLSQLVDRPVFDKTELKENFQVSLTLSIENLLLIARSSGLNLPMPAAGTPGVASDPSGGSSVFASVKQLGLNLEPQKAPTDFLVVDQLEKVPTEN
jgi:uncharacterized protein (TIGR03435 family)